MKMGKLPMPDFCPLKVILDPVEENSQQLELLDTEEGFLFLRMKCFLSYWDSYVSSVYMGPASWISFGIIDWYLQKGHPDRPHLPP